MSRYEYQRSEALADEPFYALLMAAMRKADDVNRHKLMAMWPERWQEFRDRYEAPGGRLPTDEVTP